ncbi:branched-chain amino acid transport system substrate-binding protein [Desulfobaculum xiamenense]|uniref:Branched-chain amino acid transport system substrate-binding protein n=1 Tax=Desulfobaculum xiamenense TaxID=995050 RepID=A0A846QJX4_9BACT|nr:ABC transporter substrate-binding protein [Desulfobaculum xiamenense]NJB68441.1 branched-chain amino acid transport system substrate-binding protein [Desulfobaculum xiamenense]
MRMMVRLAAVLLCLSMGVAHASEPIRVAAIFAATGEASLSNALSFDVLRFGVERINADGGLLGRPVELLEFDNKSITVASKTAAEAAVAQGATFVIGPSWSSHALAAAQVLQKAGIPMMATTATAPEVTKVGDFIFRACFLDDFQGVCAAEFAWRDLHFKRAAVLVNVSNAYSVSLASEFERAFTGLGGDVVYQAEYLTDERNFEEIFANVVRREAEVVFIPGYPHDTGQAITQARSMNLAVTFLGGDSWSPMNRMPLGWSNSTSIYYVTHWHRDAPTPESRAFVEEFSRAAGADVLAELSPGNVLAYDALQLFAAAVRAAGSAEPRRIRDALAATNGFRGATGTFSFDEQRNPRKDAFILQIVGEDTVFVKTVHSEGK